MITVHNKMTFYGIAGIARAARVALVLSCALVFWHPFAHAAEHDAADADSGANVPVSYAQVLGERLDSAYHGLRDLSADEGLSVLVRFSSALAQVVVEDVRRAADRMRSVLVEKGVTDWTSLREELPYLLADLWQPWLWWEFALERVAVQPLETLVLLLVLVGFGVYFYHSLSGSTKPEKHGRIMPTLGWSASGGAAGAGVDVPDPVARAAADREAGAQRLDAGSSLGQGTSAPSAAPVVPPPPAKPAPIAGTNPAAVSPQDPVPTSGPVANGASATGGHSDPASVPPVPGQDAGPGGAAAPGGASAQELADQAAQDVPEELQQGDAGEAQVALNRARIYIDVPGHRRTAVSLLRRVVEIGDEAARKQAQEMLDKIEE